MTRKVKIISGTAILLLVAVAFTAGWLISRENPRVVINPYPLIDFARSFIPQEDFIVNIQPLREELIAMSAKQKNLDVSIYFEFLNTGANISINKDLAVWPASLLKVPVALAVMKKIENGEWTAETKLMILEEDKNVKHGNVWLKPTGSYLTVDELIQEMLVNSDNTAYEIFLRTLANEELYAVLESLGIEELFDEEGKLTAKEYSRVFRALYTSSFLKRENSQKILLFLAQTPFNEFLASGVPSGVFFSHKFGIHDELHSYLDSGIVYVLDRPYLLTVAIAGKGAEGEREEARAFMKEVSESAYTYISSK